MVDCCPAARRSTVIYADDHSRLALEDTLVNLERLSPQLTHHWHPPGAQRRDAR